MAKRQVPNSGPSIGHRETRLCDVFDAAGNYLASAVMRLADGGGALLLSRVVGKGNLLGYYFGRGGRLVTIEAGDFRLRGRLRTRWMENERLWIVDLEESAAASAAER
ncbi:hypothetical protein HRbin29_01624 [bacterium HR29]|jgi:hypothetical protein|nr:hypothetical protein HRbin29_01624 [bacterium HR29]